MLGSAVKFYGRSVDWKQTYNFVGQGSEMKLDIPVHYHYQHYNIIHLNISIFVFHVIIHINFFY